MGEIWLTRLFVVVLFVGLAKSAPVIAMIIVGIGVGVVIIRLFHEAGYLPGFLMDVLDRLTNKTALESKMKEREAKIEVIDAEQLAVHIKSRVIGQDKVADEVAAQLRRRLAAKRPGRPLAVFCFAGPPGVGKTYFAKVLAEQLFGHEKYLQFFDMSQYAQAYSASSLFGAALCRIE